MVFHSLPGPRLAAAVAILAAFAGSQACLSCTRQIPSFSVRFLGNDLFPTAVNDLGRAVGWTTLDGATRAWVATGDGAAALLPLLPGSHASLPNDINDNGVAVGWSGGAGFPRHAVAWRPAADGYEVIDLGTLQRGADAISEAAAINNAGQIVGFSRGAITGDGPTSTAKAFLYAESSGMVELDFRSEGGVSVLPADINDAGQIVGGSLRMHIDDPFAEDLGVPAGNYLRAVGHAINDFGQVTGYAQLATSLPDDRRIIRYTDGIGWEVLSAAGPYNMGYGINNRGDVSAEAVVCSSGPAFQAALYLQGLGLKCLKDLLVDADRDWSINATFGNAMNDRGEVVGVGYNGVTGESGAVLLVPVGPLPQPSAPAGLHTKLPSP